MPEKIQFYFDEHVPVTVAVGLRLRGADVLTVQESQRAGLTDLEQLQFATVANRVLVTFDTDFLKIGNTQAVQHAGIIWCPATKYSVGELIRALMMVHALLTPEEMRGAIEYL